MRIAVLTDVHANLPALQAALEDIRREGCDAIYHTGDAIAIGPQPAECLDLLLRTPDVRLLMGNHDAWFVDGLPQPQPPWMSDGEVAHQRWVHAQLDPSLRPVVARWPHVVREEWEGVRVVLAHYEPADSDSGFAPAIRDAGPDELDRLFAHYGADVAFYGHTHTASDVTGRARYVNPGSLGCHREALARYLVLECCGGRYTVEQRAAPYDDGPLFEAFERRRVPERAFLYRAFFGGRYGGQV
jgi:putative phosphoesterase